MFTVNISLKAEHQVVEQLKEWMKQNAMPQIAQNVDVHRCTFHSLLGHADEHGETFVIQIHIANRSALDDYLKNFQSRLHGAIRSTWGDQVLFFETVLQEIP